MHIGIGRILHEDVVEGESLIDDIVRNPSRLRDIEVASYFWCAEV